jgi:hypothetical protein
MRKTRRLWTSLTVAGAILPVTSILQIPAAAADDGHSAAVHANAGSSGIVLAQGGEGGEGGEGGAGALGGEAAFDASKATTDPVVYLTALEVIRAHYLAGLAAYAAGEVESGAEMFAHARSEIYVDLEPALTNLGVNEFDDLMQSTGDLANSNAPPAEVEAAAKSVFAALDGAAAKAPGPSTVKDITTVFADLMDRAALQYARAKRNTDETDAYLDGYGLFQAAKIKSAIVLPSLDASNPDAASAARAALAALAAAYPSIERPAAGAPEPGPSLVATSKFRLALSSR